MRDAFLEIQSELELTKKELETRLLKEYYNKYDTEISEELTFHPGKAAEEQVKRKMLVHHIKEDLQDVKRALLKMQLGIYGICEETGTRMEIKQLRILPTARTVADVSYQRFYR
ncbi:molecular chaperone DnaK [Priestia taiwanensis]|uniref:Molecular chaperone DnaK n=1 Tax=Priestia taiwanensis TaxID=1347902 RepID=A0A917APN8_9BACI|nr:molecular chaperone DnaK [Priestia taiwanensis]MBM7362916.1 RNA polymerase-binding transcription factor DksA [Priestia taiwanensis]GGE66133.1 molecular chaperone DnaK [Priestia taiwanensis]